jgi:hypothetical protein
MIKLLILFCLLSNVVFSQLHISRQDVLSQGISKISSYTVTTTKDSLALGLRAFDTTLAAKVFRFYNANGLLWQQDYFNTMFVKKGVINYLYADTLLVEEIDNAYESAYADKTRRTVFYFDSTNNSQFILEHSGYLEVITYQQPRWNDVIRNKKWKTSYYAEALIDSSSCEISFNGKRYVLQSFNLFSYFDGINISRVDNFQLNRNESNNQLRSFINTTSEVIVRQGDSIKETITLRTGFSTTLNKNKVVECDNVPMSYNVPDVIKTVRERYKSGRLIETVTNDLGSSFIIVEHFIYDLNGVLIEKRSITTYTPTNSTSYSKIFYAYEKR